MQDRKEMRESIEFLIQHPGRLTETEFQAVKDISNREQLLNDTVKKLTQENKQLEERNCEGYDKLTEENEVLTLRLEGAEIGYRQQYDLHLICHKEIDKLQLELKFAKGGKGSQEHMDGCIIEGLEKKIAKLQEDLKTGVRYAEQWRAKYVEYCEKIEELKTQLSKVNVENIRNIIHKNDHLYYKDCVDCKNAKFYAQAIVKKIKGKV